MTPTTSKPRRGRPRKVESYAQWAARIDAEVEAAARSIQRTPPTLADFHPAQRRILELMIEQMRQLPSMKADINITDAPGYDTIRTVIWLLLEAKHGRKSMEWPVETMRDALWLIRNSSGRAPIKTTPARDDEDDDED